MTSQIDSVFCPRCTSLIHAIVLPAMSLEGVDLELCRFRRWRRPQPISVLQHHAGLGHTTSLPAQPLVGPAWITCFSTHGHFNPDDISTQTFQLRHCNPEISTHTFQSRYFNPNISTQTFRLRYFNPDILTQTFQPRHMTQTYTNQPTDKSPRTYQG